MMDIVTELTIDGTFDRQIILMMMVEEWNREYSNHPVKITLDGYRVKISRHRVSAGENLYVVTVTDKNNLGKKKDYEFCSSGLYRTKSDRLGIMNNIVRTANMFD